MKSRILGLILITTYERFNGSPMLAVLLGALIFLRLLVEVSQNRWQQLTNEEKSDLKTKPELIAIIKKDTHKIIFKSKTIHFFILKLNYKIIIISLNYVG